jgi:translation initiation factor 1 (eIF-1/SUI1)
LSFIYYYYLLLISIIIIFITIIFINTKGIDIKQAAKFFGSKFACGASVVATGKSQAVAIQGLRKV